MLTDYRNSFAAGKMTKFTTKQIKIFHQTLNMLLHYLVKCKRSDSVAGFVYESVGLLKDKELSLQLASGTRIRNLVCRLRKIS